MPGDCPEAGALETWGKNKAFRPPFDMNSINSGDPIEAITKLIAMEEKAEPELVGGNIDIIQIGRSARLNLADYVAAGAWIRRRPSVVAVAASR
jgi:hypothetical protein